MSDNNTPSNAIATAISALNRMDPEKASASPLLANMVLAESIAPAVASIGAIFVAAAAADAARQNERHALRMEEERACMAHRRRMEELEYQSAAADLAQKKARPSAEKATNNGKAWAKPARDSNGSTW